MPSGNTKGIEIIGFDPDNKSFSMQSFDSQGGKNTMQATVQDDQWTFIGDGVRFVGRFQESGNVFAGAWELRSDPASDWRLWLTVRLTKVGGLQSAQLLHPAEPLQLA
jgi:hypothetical protein